MTQAISITSPPGRVVDGNLYTPQTTDADGNPLVIKTGQNAGQPRVNYYFAVAIPKAGEQHWSQTAWGQQIWSVGHQAFPQAAQSPTFAWKVEDGDSQIPNKRGRKNADREGYPGNWIVKLSSGYAPRIYKQDGGGGYVQVMDKDFVKPGYYVEVAFTVDGNGSQQQPGVYINHSMVLFRAYGQEIVFGPDPASAGFGSAPLPPGASLTPPASAMPPPASAMPLPAQAQVPIPVLPNPGFVQVPPPVPTVPGAASAAPGYPPPPSSVPVSASSATTSLSRTMTPKANGLTYEAYVGSGWTDEQLVQHGLMVA